ncbi:MAG: REP-associated tyrosine transposase [Pseudomonadota bacterium]
MVRYRRVRVPDGTFFFTVTLRDRRGRLLVDELPALRAAWRSARMRVAHDIVAAVVLPDHLHAVLRMRDGAGDYSRLWQEIKKGFTRRVRAPGAPSPWQARFREHMVRDEADLRRCLDYVHFNPVKHGHAVRVRDWPYSTFHRHARAGALPIDWGGEASVP